MKITKELILEAFKNLVTAKAMTQVYEDNFKVVSKYVHATSRGHEVIQTALGMQLLPQDYLFPYYRDDAMLPECLLAPMVVAARITPLLWRVW